MARFSSFVVGAGLMYLLDPDRGTARRARFKNALVHAGKVEGNLFRKGLRDAQNRAQGVKKRVRRAFSEPAADEVVLGRIRARLGRAVTHAHAHAIDIEIRDGRAIARGPVLASQAEAVLGTVRGTAGVREVIDRLERHATAGAIQSLQGGERRERRGMMWPPAAQVGAIGAGALLLGYGLLIKRGVAGGLLGAAGGALLLRGAVNRSLPHLVSPRAEVMVQKTVVVHAPIHKVFDLWSQFENFPRFMRHVRDIDIQAGGKKSRWTVDGPAHTTVSFEAETIELEPDRVLAWRTLPSQQIDHEGRVRFEKIDDATTRVTVRMTYRPPGGVVGHAIAHILGWDPKSRIDDDLVRMKGLLEDGKVRTGGERIRLTEFH
jgi:uncharacterized membrane protein